ncbi:MAG: hypothetical protein PUD43_07445 [Clostridia bacterium]|nr:hypothetical protein [Clostridia bacterium]
MIEQDTVRLLRECDAGIRMGIDSIEEVLEYIEDNGFKQRLEKCRSEHVKLENDIEVLLDKYHDEGKKPDPIAKGMSWIKTNTKLAMDGSDSMIADLMTDGCNMGVKSLTKYLNKYKAADESSKDIAKKLINIEEQLTEDIKQYL